MITDSAGIWFRVCLFLIKVWRIKIKSVFFLMLSALLIVLTVNSVIKMIYPLKYKDYVVKYSSLSGLDDPNLVFSVIKAESGFESDATSRSNARGLMQITDSTGVWAAEKMGLQDFRVENLYDPETNIRIGCWYLKNLIEEFEDYNYNDRINLALASYNAGIGRVKLWLEDKDLSSTGERLDKIPYEETDTYVRRVNNYYAVYKKIYD